jgi:transcriptional regulator with XRE-family HTH domain
LSALNEDLSLGASIRRLRWQHGLSREDSPGLSAKAIARIERSEIGKPHSKTLVAIAHVLGVPVGQLDSY